MNFSETMKTYRGIPETARVGLKWTDEENKELMKEVMEDGMHLEDIAKKHQRTTRGVKLKIMSNALDMMEEKNLTIHQVAKLVHIPADELEIESQRLEQQKERTEERRNFRSQEKK